MVSGSGLVECVKQIGKKIESVLFRRLAVGGTQELESKHGDDETRNETGRVDRAIFCEEAVAAQSGCAHDEQHVEDVLFGEREYQVEYFEAF